MISAPMVARVNEEVTLSAAASLAGNDSPLKFQWFVIQESGLGAADTTTLIPSMEGGHRLRLKVSNGKVTDITDIDEYELFATYKNDGEFFDAEDTFPPLEPKEKNLESEEPESVNMWTNTIVCCSSQMRRNLLCNLSGKPVNRFQLIGEKPQNHEKNQSPNTARRLCCL